MAVDHDHAAEGGVRENGAWRWQDANKFLHRTDGPAWIDAYGNQAWWFHGQRHRADGPAIIGVDGYQVWFMHGRRHRVDGPAIIHANGGQEWHVQGRDITREVDSWLRDNGITLPFTTEQQAEFLLRWG